MSLPGLFLKEVSSNGDLALTKLPQDMDQWAETIVSKVKEKLPTAKTLLMKVTFIQKNEELGTATGAVTIHDQKLNKSIFIPLIVKNFKLYPLDVMILPKKDSEQGMDIVPLTEDYFAEAMFNNDVFDHLERPMDRIQQLYLNPQNAVVYPPGYRNVYASAQVLETIKETIQTEDKVAFIQNLKENKESLIGYEKRANVHLLQKIADSKVTMDSKSIKNDNVFLIKKDLNNNFRVYYTSDEVFDPIVENIDHNYIREHLSKITDSVEETLNEVNRNGEYIVMNNLKPQDSAMVTGQSKKNYTNPDEKPVKAVKFESYRVMDKMGVQHKGIVIPNIVNFDRKLINTKIFFNENKTAYQDKIVGIPTSTEPTQFLKTRYPEVGMTGTFITYNEKNAVATIPITIRSVHDENCSYVKIVAEDMNGKKVKIKYSCDNGLSSMYEQQKENFEGPGKLKEIVKIKDFYLVPNAFKFLPLSNFCELIDNPGTMRMKTASMELDASPIRVIHTGANQFSLKGPEMSKMANLAGWDATNLSAGQSIFLLTSKKSPLSKTAEAIKEAANYGEAQIHHLPVTLFGKQYFAKLEKEAAVKDRYLKSLRVDLTKEASQLDESQLVDAALSLNFINSVNIEKFISFVPYFRECIKMLAQSLLASRVGMTEIPEQDTQTAMFKMIDVVKGLERLRDHKQD